MRSEKCLGVVTVTTSHGPGQPGPESVQHLQHGETIIVNMSYLTGMEGENMLRISILIESDILVAVAYYVT